MFSSLFPFKNVVLLLSGFRTLSAVLGATLCAACHACGIKSTTNDVVTHTRKVLYTTAAHKHDRVLLKVVAFAGDVGVNFL